MSDGITLFCPSCGKPTALNKECDEIPIKLKHPKKEGWYDSHFPVYTCQNCKRKHVIEGVI